LLGFVSLFAPAVVRGNTIVIVPSEKYPLAALDLYQVGCGMEGEVVLGAGDDEI
jgi:acyl-CoA reductase-like NAD-dependent aldehyde dehydrogenase